MLAKYRDGSRNEFVTSDSPYDLNCDVAWTSLTSIQFRFNPVNLAPPYRACRAFARRDTYVAYVTVAINRLQPRLRPRRSASGGCITEVRATRNSQELGICNKVHRRVGHEGEEEVGTEARTRNEKRSRDRNAIPIGFFVVHYTGTAATLIYSPRARSPRK